MHISKETALKKRIIRLGKQLYKLGLVVAGSGNISCRKGTSGIIITAKGASLGRLSPADFCSIDSVSRKATSGIRPSSEFPLHRCIYENLPVNCVIHCHPPLTNAYFSVCASLKSLTFETKLYLGTVPVITQKTPTVTNLVPVIKALEKNNLAVLKNHGVVSIGNSFEEALDFIEMLEEAIKVSAIARLLRRKVPDCLDEALKKNLRQKGLP